MNNFINSIQSNSNILLIYNSPKSEKYTYILSEFINFLKNNQEYKVDCIQGNVNVSPLSFNSFLHSDFIIAVNDLSKIKILKNRYGVDIKVNLTIDEMFSYLRIKKINKILNKNNQ